MVVESDEAPFAQKEFSDEEAKVKTLEDRLYDVIASLRSLGRCITTNNNLDKNEQNSPKSYPNESAIVHFT